MIDCQEHVVVGIKFQAGLVFLWKIFAQEIVLK